MYWYEGCSNSTVDRAFSLHAVSQDQFPASHMTLWSCFEQRMSLESGVIPENSGCGPPKSVSMLILICIYSKNNFCHYDLELIDIVICNFRLYGLLAHFYSLISLDKKYCKKLN